MKILISNSHSFYIPLEYAELLASKGDPWAIDQINEYKKRLSRPEVLITLEEEDNMSEEEYLSKYNSHDWYHYRHVEDKDSLRFNPYIMDTLTEYKEIVLKSKWHGMYDLNIVEIPDDVEWEICRNDEFGTEWVAEKHRKWNEHGEFSS